MKGSLPYELANAGFQIERFEKKSHHEYHGPCPMCGGENRFTLYTDRPWPSWNGWCRICHPTTIWIDELNPNLKVPLTPERVQALRAQAEEAIKQEIALREEALANLRQLRVWEQYHEALTEGARALWRSWGVPDDMQNYWELGFCADKVFKFKDDLFHTPTLTIPVFRPVTREVVTVRHRLLSPPDPKDKYRPDRKHLPSAPWFANLEQPVEGSRLIITEGEKKAAVVFITLEDPGVQVAGIAGKNFDPEAVKSLASAGEIFVIHDPGAEDFTTRIAEVVGAEKVRDIALYDKIDDTILRYRLGSGWLRSLLRQGRKVRL